MVFFIESLMSLQNMLQESARMLFISTKNLVCDVFALEYRLAKNKDSGLFAFICVSEHN